MKDTLKNDLGKLLAQRKENHLYRSLTGTSNLTDFSSNDYLGFARSRDFYKYIKQNEIVYEKFLLPGAGASRLISGNHPLYENAETKVAKFHKAEAALIFNSGYDANIGLFSCLCNRHDTILYDEFVHASIRDGIRLSLASSYSFHHNNLDDLKKKVSHARRKTRGNIFVVVESVYSMDGIGDDAGSINTNGIHHEYWIEYLAEYCDQNGFNLIVDEAHATGVFGERGEGLVVEKNLTDKVFARVHTFGKALGVHGAAVLGPYVLREYLINYSRSFIYTTALPPHSLLSILSAYEYLEKHPEFISSLKSNISYFKMHFYSDRSGNNSAVHYKIIGDNQRAREASMQCSNLGFNVRAILSPTVPKGTERLRICLHSFNTKKEIEELVKILQKF